MSSTATSPTLRFAVLLHGGIDDPHFDLLVETSPGSDLATWRSPVWPIEQPVKLTGLKDHRRIYLNFEGELSDGRGNVHRVDAGVCRVVIGDVDNWTIYFENCVLTITRLSSGDWQAQASPLIRG